jgi:hypothetical protein
MPEPPPGELAESADVDVSFAEPPPCEPTESAEVDVSWPEPPPFELTESAEVEVSTPDPPPGDPTESAAWGDSVALPAPPSSSPSSSAFLPAEKTTCSFAALRLLSKAGSTAGRVLGMAGACGAAGRALVLMMTIRGGVCVWEVGVQVMLP